MSAPQDGGRGEKLLDALMEGAFSGILFVDAAGKVLRMNDRARTYLNCRDRDVEGESVMNLFPLLDRDILDAVLKSGDSIANYYAHSRTVRFAVNIEPVGAAGKPEGAVLLLRRMPQPTGAAAEPSAPGLTAGHRFSDFRYASENFQRMLKNAKLASHSDAPILLTGENGTEIPEIAECIHNESGRQRFGYAEVECDAHSAEQISRLLFDRTERAEERGSGAISDIRDGTLFLNHIDRLSQELQYRVCLLIKGQYAAQNDIRHFREDIRVIAGTEKRLKDLVRQGLFREDLYYALSVVTLAVPPLRERRDDIVNLANMFLRRYSAQFAKPVKFTRGAYDSLQQYDWPGNMRELDYFCKKIVLTTPSHSVNEAFIKSALSESVEGLHRTEETEAPDRAATDKRAQEILDALRRNNGSKTKTAEELGISKATLWRHMQKYGITQDFH